ncbi:MAG TPA: pilus assembly protein N-terminal domain-containing protein [Verrucomicrobiae bacterium]|jgi:Flp pilus assembly secretin CpaC
MKQQQTQLFTKIFGILILSACCAAMSARADDLVILQGTTAKLGVTEGIKKIDVGNPSVIDARPSDDGLSVIVNGTAVGTSELRVEKLQGSDLITNVVVRTDLNETMSQVQNLLSDVEGLNISIVGNKVVLQGSLLTASDYEKVNKVVGLYGGTVVNMSTFDKTQMNKYLEQAILKDIGVDTVTARVMGDTVVLDGYVYNDADLKRAEQLAKLRVPTVVNLIRLQDVMIETDLEFIDLSTSHSFNWGYDVLDSVSANVGGNFSGHGQNHTGGQSQVVPGASGSLGAPTPTEPIPLGFPITYGVTASASANAQITADLGDGSARIVAQPHISTKSGEEGTFQDGFTSYYQEPGQVGGPSSLTSVNYGVIVKVKPILEGEHRIMNSLELQISEPIAAAAGSVLSLDSYDTKATALCNEGESMVVSGMVQEGSNRSKNGAPLLRDIPLVDLFFANKATSKNRDEFVILVTPQAVLPTVAPGTPFSEQHTQLFQQPTSKE